MTEANLKDAFAGESQAHMKYLAFAESQAAKAFQKSARLFTAIAYGRTSARHQPSAELGGIGDTLHQPGGSLGGENFENTEMYPAYQAVAQLQEEKGALRTIFYALEAEKIHEVMYDDTAETVKPAQTYPRKRYSSAQSVVIPPLARPQTVAPSARPSKPSIKNSKTQLSNPLRSPGKNPGFLNLCTAVRTADDTPS